MRAVAIPVPALLAASCSQARGPLTAPAASRATFANRATFDPATAANIAAYRGRFALAYADGTRGTATFHGDDTITAEFAGQPVIPIDRGTH